MEPYTLDEYPNRQLHADDVHDVPGYPTGELYVPGAQSPVKYPVVHAGVHAEPHVPHEYVYVPAGHTPHWNPGQVVHAALVAPPVEYVPPLQPTFWAAPPAA